jgi:hypothetical protein
MENGQKTISDLFDGRKIFNIPEYQRAYAWGKKQLQDFVDDIENQNLHKDYFFGTLLFHERGSEGNYELIDVVDGQQRITTLIIFMKLLLEKLKKMGDDVEILEETYLQYKKEYKLRALAPDSEFFRSYILQDNTMSEEVIRTTSQRRLLNAKIFLTEKLKDLPIESLRTFKDKIERTKVLIYSVIDNAEAALIFETTNDRGKTLTNLEKTKSFLMYKTYLASGTPNGHLDDIQNRFTDIYRDHETVEDKIGEDAILQYHFIAFEKWSVSKGKKEYQQYVLMIKKYINGLVNKDPAAAINYIDQYSRELRESFAIIKSFMLYPEKYLSDIFALGRPANFYPLLIKTYKFDSSDNKSEFKKICRLIEIISFRVFGIRRRRSHTGTDELFRLARDFNGDFLDLQNSLIGMIESYCNDTEFRTALLSPTFYLDIAPNDKNYLFWKYENHLRRTEQPIFSELSYAEFINLDKRTKFSIEHIIPQNPKDTKVISDLTILPEMTNEFKERYLHSIGNLTIDPLSANISKSNNDFVLKNLKYFRKAPLKTQNELESFLINPNSIIWDKQAVEQRRDKILQFALECWSYKVIS